ncbi:MAG: GLPGLI family protein [Bacteroidota bacterium]
MIRIFIFSLAASFALFTQGVLAQKLQGRAVYRSAVQVSFSAPEGSKMSDMDKAAMQAQLAQALTKDYELVFNNQESTYTKMESLEASSTAKSGGFAMVIGDGGQDQLYKNTETRTYKKAEGLLGKAFLIEDELTLPEWTLVEEYKEIVGQKCQKAQLTKIREITDFNDMSKTKMDTVYITAWFATEIPVAQGPKSYWGLPGLILEVSTGNASITCTELELNPSEEIVIEVPKKGRKVTQEEYDQISDEKIKELTQGYKGKGGKITIQTGG